MWGAIGKAINDTIFRGKIKPLNKIVEDDSYDTYYNSMLTYVNAYGDNGGTIAVVPFGVTEITSNSGFYGNTTIKTVVIPRTVKKISDSAFSGCSNLSGIIVPKSVEKITHNAFYKCTSLTGIFIPESVTYMEDAFSGCSNLTDIYVGWKEGAVARDPWSAPNATIHYEVGIL